MSEERIANSIIRNGKLRDFVMSVPDHIYDEMTLDRDDGPFFRVGMNSTHEFYVADRGDEKIEVVSSLRMEEILELEDDEPHMSSRMVTFDKIGYVGHW